jgi:two-component system response regulator FixJ
MSNEPVIHLIDDDEALRDSLSFLLSSAGVEVRTHASAVAFLEELPRLSVSLVVSDVRMPEMTGVELLRRLKAIRPSLPVILLTGHGDVPLAVEAIKLGAADFFEKPFDDEVILAAVRRALEDQTKTRKKDAEREEAQERLRQISGRERQVLGGLVAGKANKVIAHDLDISPRTVEVYRANLMTKMHASSLSELVRMALLAGVLDGEPSS